MLALPFIFWHQSAKSYFFLEGIYFLILALIPMQLGIFRNLITFIVMMIWLTVYFTDFVIDFIFLNVVSFGIFFIIYPSVYKTDDSNFQKICFVILLNIIIVCIELTSVYIETVGDNYQKQKGESLMLLDKSKEGIMIKQSHGKGGILFVNKALSSLIDRC